MSEPTDFTTVRLVISPGMPDQFIFGQIHELAVSLNAEAGWLPVGVIHSSRSNGVYVVFEKPLQEAK